MKWGNAGMRPQTADTAQGDLGYPVGSGFKPVLLFSYWLFHFYISLRHRHKSRPRQRSSLFLLLS